MTTSTDPDYRINTICGCGAKAGGISAAHCTVCHRTFGRVSGFDKHRAAGQCLDPQTLDMQQVTRHGWTRWVGILDQDTLDRLTAGHTHHNG